MWNVIFARPTLTHDTPRIFTKQMESHFYFPFIEAQFTPIPTPLSPEINIFQHSHQPKNCFETMRNCCIQFAIDRICINSNVGFIWIFTRIPLCECICKWSTMWKYLLAVGFLFLALFFDECFACFRFNCKIAVSNCCNVYEFASQTCGSMLH